MNTFASSSKALNLFISHSRSKFIKNYIEGKNNLRKLHLVMGNEALDLDSAVSSLLLANLYHHYNINTYDGEKPIYDVIPLFPIERKDFVLRKDIALLFENLCIDVENILFFDDFDIIVRFFITKNFYFFKANNFKNTRSKWFENNYYRS